MQSAAGTIGDICDGVVYQELINAGFLMDSHNFSLIMNTDGIPVFRSSAASFWPIWLLINELPFRMRYTYI